MTYTCDHCGGRFDGDRTDAECAEECRANFGFVPNVDDRATICDGCYQEFMVWAEREGLLA